jgi:hypothetical protein
MLDIEGSTVRIQTSNSDRLDVDLSPQRLNMSLDPRR